MKERVAYCAENRANLLTPTSGFQATVSSPLLQNVVSWFEPVAQLSEPAVRAESEGILGRAWRSVASEALKERKRREDTIVFAALSDPDKAEGGEVMKDCPKRKEIAAGVKDNAVGMEFCPLTYPLREDVDTNSLRRAVGCFKRQIASLRILDRFSAPVPALEPKVLPAEPRIVDAVHVSSRECMPKL